MGKNVILIALFVSACASTSTGSNADTYSGQEVSPPTGFVNYCIKYPDRPECGAK